MNQPIEKLTLKEGLKFTITAAITDVAIFNHYVLKEYAPRAQGNLALSKNPAKHTLENCLYDEISGWLDMPTITGISVLNIEADASAFPNPTISEDPKISFSDIVALLYNVCKLNSICKKNSKLCQVDSEQLQELKEKAKQILQHLDKAAVNVNAPKKKSTHTKMGSGVFEGSLSDGLPKTS